MPLQLSPKRLRFVQEYLIDLNATQAAIRAGYSANCADVTGHRLLGDARVAAAIKEGQEKRAVVSGLTAERVLLELKRIALHDPRGFYHPDGGLKKPHELNDDQAAALASLETIEEFDGRGDDRCKVGDVRKVKFWDKPRAIEMALKHLGLLVEKREHSGPNGGPIPLHLQFENLPDDELDQRLADLEARVSAAAGGATSP